MLGLRFGDILVNKVADPKQDYQWRNVVLRGALRGDVHFRYFAQLVPPSGRSPCTFFFPLLRL